MLVRNGLIRLANYIIKKFQINRCPYRIWQKNACNIGLFIKYTIDEFNKNKIGDEITINSSRINNKNEIYIISDKLNSINNNKQKKVQRKENDNLMGVDVNKHLPDIMPFLKKDAKKHNNIIYYWEKY